jgi:dihydrofolate reductase
MHDKDFDLIVAVGLNGIIGNSVDNSIPWYLPRDLQHFKQMTLGKTIVMGSRTWASLPVHPLKGRRNVVISRQETGFMGADAQYASLIEALRKEDNVMVIGGGQIYEDCLAFRPKHLYITIVETNPKGDVHFPISGEDMLYSDVISVEGHPYIATNATSMEENGYSATMKTFVRT